MVSLWDKEQNKYDHFCLFYSTLYLTKCRMVVARGWGRGNRELLFNGHKVSVMQDDWILDIRCITWLPELTYCMWLPWWLSSKEPACQCRRHRFVSWVRKIPWGRKWQLTPAFSPGKSHRQRSLESYTLRGHKNVGHSLVAKQQHCLLKIFVKRVDFIHVQCPYHTHTHKQNKTKSKKELLEIYYLDYNDGWASHVVLVVKNPPANADVRDSSLILGLEDPLEEDITTHSSILAWRILWRKEPGGLWSMG